jgi:DnaK suppressor protein
MKKTIKKNTAKVINKKKDSASTSKKPKIKRSSILVAKAKISKVTPKTKTNKTKVTNTKITKAKTTKSSKAVKMAAKPKSKTVPPKKTTKKMPLETKRSIKPKVIARNNKQSDKPPLTFQADEYMDAKQQEHFRAILLRWKTQIMEKVDNTKSHMQEEVANYPDPIDRANHEEEFNLELRTRDRERKLIHKIDDALGRIKDGDYGYCDACGAEIGVKRLEARPTATQCIECKKIAEVKERQTGEGSIDF